MTCSNRKNEERIEETMPRTKIGDHAKSLNRQPIIEMILGRITVNKIPRCDVAKVLGISEATFNYRLREWKQDKWSYGDLVKMCKFLGLSSDEFCEKIRF